METKAEHVFAEKRAATRSGQFTLRDYAVITQRLHTNSQNRRFHFSRHRRTPTQAHSRIREPAICVVDELSIG